MSAYYISTEATASGSEMRVLVRDQHAREVASVNAFSGAHALGVVHDLMMLLRRTDPDVSVVLDTHIRKPLSRRM
jgi:hypothetical protein